MAEVAAEVRKSLVHIRSGRRGAGAGSIWHPDGLIVTNAHVAGSRALEVTLPDGRSVPATLLAHDPQLDLAALSVDATGLPAVPVGDSRGLKPGEIVLAMGHPCGVEGATTAGVVIDNGPYVPELTSSSRQWIVANLPLRPGHSGGPMMDTEGRLVGISTMITGPEVAMAVPVHVVKGFLKDALGADRAAVA